MKFIINCMRLRKMFEKINKLTDECVLDLKATGMKAEVVDKGMVCVGVFSISRDKFSSYDSISKGVLCGVNVPKILSILKRINGQQNVNFETGNKIKIIQDNRRFTLSQIDVDKEEIPPLNELKFDAKIKFSSEEYIQCLKDATIFSDVNDGEQTGSMKFESNGKMLKLSAKDDVDDWEAEYPALSKNPEAGMSYNYPLKSIKGTGKASYPLNYLMKSKPKSDWGTELDIKWKSEHPMELSYEEDGIKCRYVTAPMVAENE